jgi:hypothetical protein
MSQVLYTMIHNKAKSTYGKDIMSDSFKDWEKHWFDTAEAFVKEFDDNGLTYTAQAIRYIISEQKRLVK